MEHGVHKRSAVALSKSVRVIAGSLAALLRSDSRLFVPLTISSQRFVEVVLDARLVNVADGRIAWSDSARVVLDGRELAQARAGRTRDGKPLADPSDSKLSPIDLGVRRAWSALAQSLQEHLATR